MYTQAYFQCRHYHYQSRYSEGLVSNGCKISYEKIYDFSDDQPLVSLLKHPMPDLIQRLNLCMKLEKREFVSIMYFFRFITLHFSIILK